MSIEISFFLFFESSCINFIISEFDRIIWFSSMIKISWFSKLSIIEDFKLLINSLTGRSFVIVK